MDAWLQLSLSGAAIFCGGVIAREAWIKYRAARRVPLQCCTRMRPTMPGWSEDGFVSRCASCHAILYYGEDEKPAEHPVAIEHVGKPGSEVTSVREELAQQEKVKEALWPAGDEGEPLPPALAAPPNIGGEDHPPYAGPNYVRDEDVAEEMIGLPHFYAQPAEVVPLTPCVLDLAFDFELGHVAPDGAVWAQPDLRVQYGAVQIPWAEQAKAARFGWEFIGDGDEPGMCKVHRSYETWHRFAVEGRVEAARQAQLERDD
jgi:hypothetical protein